MKTKLLVFADHIEVHTWKVRVHFAMKEEQLHRFIRWCNEAQLDPGKVVEGEVDASAMTFATLLDERPSEYPHSLFWFEARVREAQDVYAPFALAVMNHLERCDNESDTFGESLLEWWDVGRNDVTLYIDAISNEPTLPRKAGELVRRAFAEAEERRWESVVNNLKSARRLRERMARRRA